ncbi:MAG: hypothetical protein QXR87_03405 [Candidatus Hadarchaeales archaeon]
MGGYPSEIARVLGVDGKLVSRWIRGSLPNFKTVEKIDSNGSYERVVAYQSSLEERVRSVLRALNPKPKSLKQVARLTKLGPWKIRNTLERLVQRGWLEKIWGSKYRLTPSGRTEAVMRGLLPLDGGCITLEFTVPT